MKYLSSYKIFEEIRFDLESLDDKICNNIKDIFIDLEEDEGFKIKIEYASVRNDSIYLKITRPTNSTGVSYLHIFRFNHIKEHVYRVKDYLKDRIEEVYVYGLSGKKYIDLEDLFNEKVELSGKFEFILEFYIKIK